MAYSGTLISYLLFSSLSSYHCRKLLKVIFEFCVVLLKHGGNSLSANGKQKPLSPFTWAFP